MKNIHLWSRLHIEKNVISIKFPKANQIFISYINLDTILTLDTELMSFCELVNKLDASKKKKISFSCKIHLKKIKSRVLNFVTIGQNI